MKNTMKKILVSILVIALLTALTACTGLVKAKEGEPQENKAAEEEAVEEEEPSEDGAMIIGGWGENESMEITDEVRSLVEKATANLLGAEYEPIAYLGHQLVAGTNHKILCKVTPVSPDAAASYVIITIYVNLQGETEIIETQNCDAEIVSGKGLMGGWDDEVPAVNEASVKALEKAQETLLGASYKEVCCLRTQIVAGTNYCLLCEITPVATCVENYYAIVTVYEDLEGNAEITEVHDFLVEE